MYCIEELEEQLKSLKATLSDKSRLKREFFLEDVMKMMILSSFILGYQR